MSLATRLRTRTKAASDAQTAIDKLAQIAGKPTMAAVIKALDTQPDNQVLVVKSADGTPRWFSRTTTAYEDQDNEVFITDALKAWTEQAWQTGNYGPLRLWHIGTKSGTPLDIGDCDLSFVCGKTLYESGTFRDPIFATMIKAGDQISPGVRFSELDINANGEYSRVDIIERSVCPPGTARNTMTGVYVA